MSFFFFCFVFVVAFGFFHCDRIFSKMQNDLVRYTSNYVIIPSSVSANAVHKIRAKLSGAGARDWTQGRERARTAHSSSSTPRTPTTDGCKKAKHTHSLVELDVRGLLKTPCRKLLLFCLQEMLV